MHLFVLRPQRNLKIKAVFQEISIIRKIFDTTRFLTKQMIFQQLVTIEFDKHFK